MPKIHIHGKTVQTMEGLILEETPNQVIECSTFKIEPTGVVYQVAPIGSAAPHASMGYYPHSMVSHITHDELIIEEVDVTDDLVQG